MATNLPAGAGQKDVATARGLEETNIPAPLVDLTTRLLAEARAELGEEADYLEGIR